MLQNKITPTLWFHTVAGNISEVVAYYQNIFGQNFEAGNNISLGKTPSGNAEMCEVKIFGQKYALMSTENEHHGFNDALAFTIHCENQNEIDTYWNYFVKEGKEVQCGWCIDKYGLRWQVLPSNFGKLMSSPNAWQIMMKQKKIIIEEYV